jgi:predicted Zn-dependent protease
VWTGTYSRGPKRGKHLVSIDATAAGLSLVRRNGEVVYWPFNGTRRKPARDGKMRLERGSGATKESLTIGDPEAIAQICLYAPGLTWRSWTESRWKKAMAVMVALMVLIPVIYIWAVPMGVNLAIRMMPGDVQQRIGVRMLEEAVPAKFRCFDPRLAGVQRLMDRLSRSRPEARYNVQVVVGDFAYANSFALPGGIVVVSRGMISRAQTPEALAGVLAHELYHARSGDATRAVFGELALTGALAAVTGRVSGRLGEMARRVGTPGFNPEDEREAERDTVRTLEAAGIDPATAIEFYRSLETDPENLPRASLYRATHPNSEGRAARLQTYRSKKNFAPLQVEGVESWRLITLSCGSMVSP